MFIYKYLVYCYFEKSNGYTPKTVHFVRYCTGRGASGYLKHCVSSLLVNSFYDRSASSVHFIHLALSNKLKIIIRPNIDHFAFWYVK